MGDDTTVQYQHYEMRAEQRRRLYLSARRRMELERALCTPFARTKILNERRQKEMETIAACTPVHYDVDRASFSVEELMLFQERMDVHEMAMLHASGANDEVSN